MTSLTAASSTPSPTIFPTIPRGVRWLIGAGAIGVGSLLIAAATRHFAIGTPTTGNTSIWLPIHLAAAVPVVPLGAWVLLRRKGDRLHKLLGRIWAGLMMIVALSSFGLVGMFGHWGPIHILSLAVIIGMPRAVLAARRGYMRGHVRGMAIMYGSAVLAALFAFLPGRMLGMWLFG